MHPPTINTPLSMVRRAIDVLLAPFRWFLRFFTYFVAGPKKIWGLSLPLRVALFSLVLVIALFLIFALAKRGDDRKKFFENPWVLTGAIVVGIGIPLAAYKIVQLWLEGEASPYQDIDIAWNEGLSALKKQGIDIQTKPVFLVVGLRDATQANSLFRATGFRFKVENIPEGGALQFFATSDAIFIACTESGCLGRLAREDAGLSASAGEDVEMAATPAVNPTGTILMGQTTVGADDPAAAPMPPADTGFTAGACDTILIDRATVDIASLIEQERATKNASGQTSIDRRQAFEETERLRYVCHRLRRARQPYAPVNGILTLLPFDLVRNTRCEIQVAASADLDAIQGMLELRCPTIALVTDMDGEDGFLELIRRVGLDTAKRRRFGKGFEVENPPIPEQIEAVTKNACGAFEDFAYKLFQDENGLNRDRGNGLLYTLMCHFRGDARDRLVQIMDHAFAHDANSADREPFLFGGLYFGATGPSEDRQALIRGVFEKLLTSEGKLSWTTAAIRREMFYRMLTFGGQIAAVVMLGFIVWTYFYNSS